MASDESGYRATDPSRIGTAEHPALDREVSGAPGRPGGLDTVVFGVTALVSLAFVIWGLVATESMSATSERMLGWVVGNLGWLFSLTATGFVIFCLWLAASRFGRIPLGRDGEAPEFRTGSWIAMMFSAGMGIGLIFYGAAEPLSHFITPPPGTGEAGNPHAMRTALATSFFHWSLHPWALYAVIGLAIAYNVFRKGRSLQISSIFVPLIGKRAAEGGPGRVIDMLAIFATLFGSATSLGLGALQIRSGMNILGWTDDTGSTLLIVIIVVLAIMFIASAISGIAKGIQWLSNFNIVLAIVLAVFIFVVGPTVLILNLLPSMVGEYIQTLPTMAGRSGSDGPAVDEWLAGWTIFYWAWWISWTPFVAMFIGRISRGRTIRQYVCGVLLVPSAVALVWFAILGGSAIRVQRNGTDLAGSGAAESQLFGLLETLPLTTITSVVVMILVAIFFVSGADAASLVMGTLSERGTLSPSRQTVIFWGAATGGVAIVMLLVDGEGGGLAGLQRIAIIAAVPFVLVMIGMAVALMKDLLQDPLIVRDRYASVALEQAVVVGVTDHGDDFAIQVDQTPEGSGVGTIVNRTPEKATDDLAGYN